MKYYIYNNESYIACSSAPKKNLDNYKEISAEEYNKYFDDVQKQQAENEDEILIQQLTDKGYTVIK
jgi:3-hydroxy-3-methylglutaryl CoA synthase